MELTSPEPPPSPAPFSHPEKSSLVYHPATYVEPLRFESLFAERLPVEIELGSGDGSFLTQYARAHPEHNFIGVERLLGRLRKTDRKGQRAGLSNLRLLRIEAAYFLTYMLPASSVQALHVYFPDPWPKRRHHPRRLIQRPFFDAAAQAVRPGGGVFLRTDDANYFAQMVDLGNSHGDFERIETPGELAGYVTDFERDFLAQGLPIHRAAYQRKRGAD